MVNPVDNPAPCPTGYIPVYSQVGEAHYRLSAPARRPCPCDDPVFCSWWGRCPRQPIRPAADERRLQHARAS